VVALTSAEDQGGKWLDLLGERPWCRVGRNGETVTSAVRRAWDHRWLLPRRFRGSTTEGL